MALLLKTSVQPVCSASHWPRKMLYVLQSFYFNSKYRFICPKCGRAVDIRYLDADKKIIADVKLVEHPFRYCGPQVRIPWEEREQ